MRSHYTFAQRVPLAFDVKLAMQVYKALHDLTAPYLVDDCQLIVFNIGRRWTSTLASSLEQTRDSVTAALRSLVQGTGTVCQQNCVSQTSN